MKAMSSNSSMNPLLIPNLVCFWDFQEAAGEMRVAQGPHAYALREGDKAVERIEDDEAPFGRYAACFDFDKWLYVPRRECPALGIGGPSAKVTVVAWIKREPSEYKGCQAIAGLWNEHGTRQYCLFLNLGIWDSREQVGAHVSDVGGPTPGYKYCMSAAIGATPVLFDEWHCVAMTYDGLDAKAYLDGRLDVREPQGEPGRNPFHFPGCLFDGGENGADFTVGSVLRPERVDEDFQPHGSVTANPYIGLLGGLAVYNRALTDEEIAGLTKL
jgi:hypothetical protein